MTEAKQDSRLRVTLVNSPPGQPEQEWRFGPDTIQIGRSSDCDIRLSHEHVSRLHATLHFDGLDWQCSCPGVNGTFLNGEIVPAITLADRMVLEFTAGGPLLRFEIDEGPEESLSETIEGDVTVWLGQLAEGDDEAAQQVYQMYFEQITHLARRRMSPAYRRVADEEDVAQSVMRNLFEGIAAGRFGELSSRENLWKLLVVMTARKAINVVEKQRAQKRGGGGVRGESILQGGSDAGGFDRFESPATRPEFLAEIMEESERQLSRLQDEVLQLIARLKMEGYTNDEIAERLGTTTRTVERKLQRIRELWADEVDSASG